MGVSIICQESETPPPGFVIQKKPITDADLSCQLCPALVGDCSAGMRAMGLRLLAYTFFFAYLLCQGAGLPVPPARMTAVVARSTEARLRSLPSKATRCRSLGLTRIDRFTFGFSFLRFFSRFYPYHPRPRKKVFSFFVFTLLPSSPA